MYFSNADKLHDLLKFHDLIFHATGLLSAFSCIFLLFYLYVRPFVKDFKP